MINDFFKSLEIDIQPQEYRWTRGMVGEDLNFFKSCIDVFKTNNIFSFLDIGTGPGTLVKMCLDSNINAYGIDPVIDQKTPNLYVGTISTAIKNENLLGDYKFSCISCVNFLHGANHNESELISLFSMMKRRADFIMITEPNIGQDAKNICMSNLECVHKFDRSHGGAYHSLYKIYNKI